jgi:uncharacterized membrane-anchored protein YjiN (DUF445 family)
MGAELPAIFACTLVGGLVGLLLYLLSELVP